MTATQLNEADVPPLFNAIPSGIMLHRGDKVLFANDAFVELIEIPRETLYEMGFWECFSMSERLAAYDRGRQRLRSDASPERFSALLATGSGDDREVLACSSVINLDGALTAIVAVIDAQDRRRADRERAEFAKMYSQLIEGDPVPTFVINREHLVTHWNRACELATGYPAAEQIGHCRQWAPFFTEPRPTLADLIVDGARPEDIDALYGHVGCQPSPVVAGAYEAEIFFAHLGDGGRWLFVTAAPIRNSNGELIGAIQTLQDFTERRNAEAAVHRELERQVEARTKELANAMEALQADIVRRQKVEAELRDLNLDLTEMTTRLADTQHQLVQSEKMASIGQLAAGVAHEINNPIGYVHSNLATLTRYVDDLLELLGAYENSLPHLGDATRQGILALREKIDLDYLRDDIRDLLRESTEGTVRVRKIVQDLKDFSRVDTKLEWQFADLHEGLDSTLNIVHNEIKYRADVVRQYGEMPQVECLPSQLNQVFLNLLVNAAQAIPESKRGSITIRTGTVEESAWIEVEDTGAGIPEANLARIFDPFFTTKPVGQGTGLGLSLSYGIVQKHQGKIEARSKVGVGTCFRITLPIRQSAAVEPSQ